MVFSFRVVVSDCALMVMLKEFDFSVLNSMEI